MTAIIPTNLRTAAIIVGVDGSPGADAALGWAIEEARVRGSEVQAVVVRSMRVAGREHLSYDELTPARCEHLLAESLERIGGAGEVPLRLETRDDDGLAFELGLEAAALGAGLIVVGRSAHGHHLGLGPSTPARLTHRLWCPLVTVPSDYLPHRTRHLLVDLDGAGTGIRALSWAVGEAALTGAALEVVGPVSARPGHRRPGSDVGRQVEEILAECRRAGIDATLRTGQRQAFPTAPSTDLLVLDSPARRWERVGFPCPSPRQGASPEGVPIVWVPAGTDWRGW